MEHLNMPICPECGQNDEYERVLEETTVISAAYVDGKLSLKEIDGCVHDSHVRCAGCSNTEFECDMFQEIEELFW
jgi:hypothetical protein